VETHAGVWVDHRKAIIVRIQDTVEETRSFLSGMEKHVRYSGGEPEDQQEHRYTNHLKAYYEKIIAFLRDVDGILILGPGEAKVEFTARLNAGPLGGRIKSVETTDKLTDRQISARTRKFFLVGAKRGRKPVGG
jgi:hypothetical protein